MVSAAGGARLTASAGSSAAIVAGADAVGCVVWAGGDDIWVHGGLHMFSKSSAVSLPDRAILTTTLILFVHILLKKGRESGPTCRDFGVL